MWHDPIVDELHKTRQANIAKFNERAKLIGLSPEEFGNKIVELIVDTSDAEFESWLETIEIFADKIFTIRLKESIKEAEQGRLTDWGQAKRELGLA